MTLLGTPADRFENLPDYDYDVQYVSVGDPEMAYVDVGPDENRGAVTGESDETAANDEANEGEETFLCLHGEPTWGFLYRKMIPILADRGRVVVPDLVGFGRSEKYTDPAEYSFAMHYESLETFLTTLDLTDVTLVGQDWGGILGLTLATRHPDRFARIVAMNTGVPDGTQDLPETWHAFAEMVATAEALDVGRLIRNGCLTDPSADVLAAYDAPFPEERYTAGARAFPGLVPRKPDDPGAAELRETQARLAEWDDPAFVLFSRQDPIFSGVRDALREHVPTASDQPDVWIEDASHFLQEDAGETVAEEIVAFVDRTP